MREFTEYQIEPSKAFPGPEESELNYNIQNVLECQSKFPAVYHMRELEDHTFEGDKTWSMWTNHMLHSEKYDQLRMKHFHNKNQSWHGCERQKTQCKAFIEDWLGHKITGFRIVRFTNVSTGYPTWRIDYFVKHPDTPEVKQWEGKFGSNVIIPIDMYKQIYHD